VWPYIISLFDIDGENGKIKMAKITFIIVFSSNGKIKI
jgi:hypothetical protein